MSEPVDGNIFFAVAFFLGRTSGNAAGWGLAGGGCENGSRSGRKLMSTWAAVQALHSWRAQQVNGVQVEGMMEQ